MSSIAAPPPEIAARDITPHVAAIVANRFDGTLGYRPSSGEAALIDAAVNIDYGLQVHLADAFPGLVAAVWMARRQGAAAVIESAAA